MFDLIRYTDQYRDKWNKFVNSSLNGTIFHHLDFLAYPGDKFSDKESHLIWLKGAEIVAVLPLAIFEKEGRKTALSPYGASYGGIITKEEFSFQQTRALIESLIEFAKTEGIDELKLTPPMNLEGWSDIVEFELLRTEAKMVNSDATSIIPLYRSGNISADHFSSSARRHFKKGLKNDIRIALDSDDLDGFWDVLDKTFAKFEIGPVHNREEWELLMKTFPDRVKMDLAYINDEPVAAIGRILIRPGTDSSFYILQDPARQHLQGLTVLFNAVLEDSAAQGVRFFDLGTSSVSMMPRENIFRFKESLGAITYLRKTYSYLFS